MFKFHITRILNLLIQLLWYPFCKIFFNTKSLVLDLTYNALVFKFISFLNINKNMKIKYYLYTNKNFKLKNGRQFAYSYNI